jgi:hypothetical protein
MNTTQTFAFIFELVLFLWIVILLAVARTKFDTATRALPVDKYYLATLIVFPLVSIVTLILIAYI